MQYLLAAYIHSYIHITHEYIMLNGVPDVSQTCTHILWILYTVYYSYYMYYLNTCKYLTRKHRKGAFSAYGFFEKRCCYHFLQNNVNKTMIKYTWYHIIILTILFSQVRNPIEPAAYYIFFSNMNLACELQMWRTWILRLLMQATSLKKFVGRIFYYNINHKMCSLYKSAVFCGLRGRFLI